MRRSGAVVAAALVAVIAGVVGVKAATGGSVDLPPVSPDRLAAEAAAALAADPAFSGTIRIHLDLGVPQLGDTDLLGSGPLSLLGDHTVRLWRSPFGLRLALVEATGERDLYLGRGGAWAWDFSTLTATRLAPPGVRTGLFPLDLLVTPEDFRGLLDSLRPTTRISVGSGVRVAGRDAYPLVLEPRDRGTLVGRLEFDVDAERRVPLALRVFPRGSSQPALDVSFTSVGFGSVDAARFDFSPPAGAIVRRGGSAGSSVGILGVLAGASGAAGAGIPGVEEVRTLGHGWSVALALRFPSVESAGLDELGRFLPLSGPLLSAGAVVDHANRFWIVVGPVPQATLVRLGRGLP